MKDKTSKYHLGGYYPPDGPAIFLKAAPMKDEHRRVYVTSFGGRIALIANFGDAPFRADGLTLPAHSVTARRTETGAATRYLSQL